MDHDVPQPSIEEKGMTIMRLHRLHFSSSPGDQLPTLAARFKRLTAFQRWSFCNSHIAMVSGCNEIENDY
jgi:hypothetical protein